MNMHATPVIRPAQRSDAEDLAKLIDLAGEGIPSWLWSRACLDGQDPLDIGIARAARDTGGFLYTNAILAETNSRPVGMVLSYAITQVPTEDPDDLPAPIAPFVALEKLSVDTWYINALAVYPGGQGKGLGTRLLIAAEDLARANGLGVMSIQVYSQNTGAVRLYQRLGYDLAAAEPVRLHPAPPYYTGDVLLLKKPL